jgi:hypothetical protein
VATAEEDRLSWAAEVQKIRSGQPGTGDCRTIAVSPERYCPWPRRDKLSKTKPERNIRDLGYFLLILP